LATCVLLAQTVVMQGMQWWLAHTGVSTALLPWLDVMAVTVLILPGFYGLLYWNRRRYQMQAAYQAELFRHNRLMNDLIKTLPDLIWAKDAEGRYLMCNPAFERFFGVRQADIIGKADADFIEPALADFLQHQYIRVRASTAAPVDEQWQTINSSHYRASLATRKIAIRDSQGQLTGILGIARDITASHRAQEELELAASVFDHADEAILIADADGTIRDVNAAFVRISGYDRAEIIGRNPRMFASGLHEPGFYQVLWRDLAEHGHWQGEIRNRRKDGALITERVTISAVHNQDGTVRHYVALYTDISELKRHFDQLEFMARHDLLTGLPNRMLITDRLQQAMHKNLRHARTLVVAFIDLDGFKAVNDLYGHEMGDHLLVAIAKRMNLVLRAGDTLARLGGDEFVVLIDELDEVSTCEAVVSRLIEQAALPVLVGEIKLQVSASIGLSAFPQTNDISPDQLLRQADHAMYAAKLAGKNRYMFFDNQEADQQQRHHTTLNRIRQALEGGELVLYYQPKVNLRSGQVIGAEALIRWQHPEQGLLPPAAFLLSLQYADPSLAIDISSWVIATALRQMSAWQAQGLILPVSVNVDTQHLQQADFAEQLCRLLADHPELPPDSLGLEILESSALEDLAHIADIIATCKRQQIEMALDDFGTGYSSLAYLKHLPVDLLKIDREFVHHMDADPLDLSILNAVIGIGSAFHARVIAEGVETVEQGNLLLCLGCDLAQGYGIARPMSAADIPGWVATWRPYPDWQAQRRLGRRHLPLLFAMVEHRDWIAKLTTWLTSPTPSTPRVHDCSLEHWLKDDGAVYFSQQPVFAELRETHRQLHDLAGVLIGWRSSPDAEDITLALKELRILGDRLLVQLESCIALDE